MSSHHRSEHSESSLLEYKELQAPADCSSSFDKVYTQTQNCNGWWYIRQCSSLTRTIEPSPWSLLKKQLKKICSIKGRSHISSTWRKKTAFYVWISQPCWVVNRDPNKIRVKQFNKLHQQTKQEGTYVSTDCSCFQTEKSRLLSARASSSLIHCQ